MIAAIIGTGGIGSAIARQLAAGGEPLLLSSADKGALAGYPKAGATLLMSSHIWAVSPLEGPEGVAAWAPGATPSESR
jgi:predicted dinucleotide-binding enzyme